MYSYVPTVVTGEKKKCLVGPYLHRYTYLTKASSESSASSPIGGPLSNKYDL